MKRPIVLQDELALQHEKQRKTCHQQEYPDMIGSQPSCTTTNSIPTDPTISHFEEDGTLFIDVQSGKYDILSNNHFPNLYYDIFVILVIQIGECE